MSDPTTFATSIKDINWIKGDRRNVYTVQVHGCDVGRGSGHVSDLCLRHVQELMYGIAKVLYRVLYPRCTEMESKPMKKKKKHLVTV